MGQEPRIPGPALRTLRWTAALAILLGFASPVDAQGRPDLPANAKGDSPPAPAYQDRIIEGISPQAAEEEKERHYDREGWPRFLRLETRLGTQPYDNGKQAAGITAAGAIDTPNYGVLSVNANYAPSEGRSAFTLRQLGLPLDGGWLMNNELGVTTPLAPGIMRLPSRIFVPSLFTRGASAEWLNAGAQVQWLASSGEPGRLQGYPVSGFSPLAGNVTTFGGQAITGDWSIAARHAHADGVSQLDNPVRPSDYFDSDSTHVAVRQASSAHSVQANVISTWSSNDAVIRKGAWVDGEWKDGTSLYGWGLYRLDPNLSWSSQAMASDIEGAYLRGSWRTRQWSAEGSVDGLRSVSGSEDTGVLVTASGRWRYSRTLTFGGGSSVRHYGGNAGTGFADVRWQNDWGSSGLRAENTVGLGTRSRRFVLDHGWLLPLGWALNTSLTAGRESGPDAAGSIWGAAVSLTAPLSASATLSGTANTERHGNGDRTSSANVSLVWNLDPNWALEGNFLYSFGQQSLALPIDPLAPLPPRITSTSNTRSVFLMLRYEDRAGSRALPLGGTALSGGGSIEGVVFLDANRNGTQEAGEGGAAGVTVYLDGRYATRTDAQGRFQFPFVAPGSRVITVLNETLPLPWEAGGRGETRVEVSVRETTRVAIPVAKRGPE